MFLATPLTARRRDEIMIKVIHFTFYREYSLGSSQLDPRPISNDCYWRNRESYPKCEKKSESVTHGYKK